MIFLVVQAAKSGTTQRPLLGLPVGIEIGYSRRT